MDPPFSFCALSTLFDPARWMALLAPPASLRCSLLSQNAPFRLSSDAWLMCSAFFFPVHHFSSSSTSPMSSQLMDDTCTSLGTEEKLRLMREITEGPTLPRLSTPKNAFSNFVSSYIPLALVKRGKIMDGSSFNLSGRKHITTRLWNLVKDDRRLCRLPSKQRKLFTTMRSSLEDAFLASNTDRAQLVARIFDERLHCLVALSEILIEEYKHKHPGKPLFTTGKNMQLTCGLKTKLDQLINDPLSTQVTGDFCYSSASSHPSTDPELSTGSDCDTSSQTVPACEPSSFDGTLPSSPSLSLTLPVGVPHSLSPSAGQKSDSSPEIIFCNINNSSSTSSTVLCKSNASLPDALQPERSTGHSEETTTSTVTDPSHQPLSISLFLSEGQVNSCRHISWDWNDTFAFSSLSDLASCRITKVELICDLPIYRPVELIADKYDLSSLSLAFQKTKDSTNRWKMWNLALLSKYEQIVEALLPLKYILRSRNIRIFHSITRISLLRIGYDLDIPFLTLAIKCTHCQSSSHLLAILLKAMKRETSFHPYDQLTDSFPDSLLVSSLRLN